MVDENVEQFVLRAIDARPKGAIVLWEFHKLSDVDDKLDTMTEVFQYNEDTGIFTINDKEYFVDIRKNQEVGFVILKPITKTDKPKPVVCNAKPDPETGYCAICGKVHPTKLSETRQQRKSLDEYREWWTQELIVRGIKLVPTQNPSAPISDE